MWNQRPGLWAPASVLLALVLAACGGGGGGNDGATSLSGWWEVGARPGGSTKTYEPFILIHTADTGSSFWANGSEFTRTGNQLLSIEPSATDPDREIISLTVVNENQLQGSVERFETDVLVEETDIRAARTTAPSGTFTMTGTVSGQPAAVSSANAYGALREGSSESEFGIYHVVPYERDTHVAVRAQETPLQARTYTIGVGPGTIEANAGSGDSDEEATSGTVTLTSVGTRLVGTYDLTLTGGAVTGSFDVEVLLPRLP